MSATFRLDRGAGRLFDGAGRSFDFEARVWTPDAEQTAGEPIELLEAVRWIQRETNARIRVPVGVIGPREASDEQLRVAEAVGTGLADIGFVVICGGRGGVMEAACKGVERAGGLSIGLLPEVDAAAANPYLSVAIATGIGEARNALVARAALCLVAIGDSLGTLSEVALGRQFGKKVIGIAGAAKVDGVMHVDTPVQALEQVARCALELPS